MSRRWAVAMLKWAATGVAYGLSWAPEDALRALAWQVHDADAAGTLASVALAMHLDIAFVPANEPWAAEAVELLHHADIGAAWAVSGVLGRVADELGWMDVLRESAAAPGELAFTLSERLHDALVEARAGVEAGADALVVADDLAGTAGWLVSPDFALEALLPCYRQLAAVGDEPAVFHSDGDIRALYPALAGAGFSAVHVAVAGEAATVSAFRAAHSAGLVPMGGVEARELLEEGAAVAGKRIAHLAAHGPVVVCDDGGMTSAEDLAAYISALEAARRAIAASSETD